MAIDLRPQLAEATNNLLTWRNRYEKQEYPFKVVQNTFYRQYAMDSIWPGIIDSFGGQAHPKKDTNTAYAELENEYAHAAQALTVGAVLMSKMQLK